jgi:hypothetical protein
MIIFVFQPALGDIVNFLTVLGKHYPIESLRKYYQFMNLRVCEFFPNK